MQSSDGTFRHEALLYSSEDEFAAGTLPFVKDAVAAGEPILAAVDERKISLLEEGLNGESDLVRFVDMADAGRNPARIIPVWHEFVDEHGGAGHPIRGIAEPVWPGRDPDELIECQRHEWLLNLAFRETPSFWLLCPYDIARLDAGVLESVELTHPHLARGEGTWQSAAYRDPRPDSDPFDRPLAEPPPDRARLDFTGTDLGPVRQLVSRCATDAGADADRVEALVIAANELASNSIKHGGGEGNVAVWRENGTVLCEVRDAGRMDDPLAGRRPPDFGQLSGRGLWMANQLCDLVQTRSLPDGNVVRLHVRLG